MWVLRQAPGTGTAFDQNSGYVKLLDELEPQPEDTRILKTSHNAFTATNLAQQLQQRGITKLRICGIRTEQCVETTTCLASDMGFEVELIIDATATHPLPLANGTGFVPAEQVIERTAAALSGRFATITTVNNVLLQ